MISSILISQRNNYKKMVNQAKPNLQWQKNQHTEKINTSFIYINSPKQMGTYQQVIPSIISLCGWLYFIIWSISFYPQILLTIKQKSAMGMNSNYIFINLTGYVMYAVYNLYGWVKGNNPETGVVDQSDILFSMHSVLAYGIIVILFFYFPHKIQLSSWTVVYLAIEWLIFLYFGVYAAIAVSPFTLTFFGYHTQLGYFQTLGYMKMCCSLLKHPPQIYYNFKRKSTKGWSIEAMVMDFLGGLFSLIALLLELYINPKLHINKAKLFLSVISMIYDVTYMIQHYVLYGDSKSEIKSSQMKEKQKRDDVIRKYSDECDEQTILTSTKILQ